MPPQLQRDPARAPCWWQHRFSLNVVGGFASRGHVFSVIGGYAAKGGPAGPRGPGRRPDLELRRAERSMAVRRPALRRLPRHCVPGGRGDQPGPHGDRPPAGPRRPASPQRRQLRILNAAARHARSQSSRVMKCS
jgi:hypothetical protein